MRFINKNLIIVFLLVIFLGNANVVFGQALCGPTPLGGAGCIASTACGFNDCEGQYDLCDTQVGQQCVFEHEACETQYISCKIPCQGRPDQAACEAICLSTKQQCKSLADATYLAAVPACITQANAFQQTFIKAGLFTGVDCAEANSCFELLYS